MRIFDRLLRTRTLLRTNPHNMLSAFGNGRSIESVIQ
jgi:hypothetical protein